MPYITSIVLRTDSKELPRWLRKNYDAVGNYYHLNAWDSHEILNADVRRELFKHTDREPEDIVYLHYSELLKFANVYDRYAKNLNIFNLQRWELKRAARDMRKLYVWLEANRPKHTLAWAEFYYTFDIKED